MNQKQKGIGALAVLLMIVIAGIIGGTAWYVLNATKNTGKALDDAAKSSSIPAPRSNANGSKPSTTDETAEAKHTRLSSNWLLRETSEASIRVPDGFEILAPKGEALTFYLPDVPQGTLKYEKGKKAVVVGEPHKHFELGLIASFNNQGLNDRGTKVREFKTYSGLDVTVKLFEQKEEPTGVDFPKGAKHLKYTVAKGADYFNVDYFYMNEGIVDIIDEMVRSIDIK